MKKFVTETIESVKKLLCGFTYCCYFYLGNLYFEIVFRRNLAISKRINGVCNNIRYADVTVLIVDNLTTSRHSKRTSFKNSIYQK